MTSKGWVWTTDMGLRKKDSVVRKDLPGGVTASIDSVSLSLEQLWETRKVAIEAEPKNIQKWEATLSPEQGRVLKEMIIHALNTLAADPEWIPYTTEISDGQMLNIHLSVLLTDVDEEVRRQESEFLKTIDDVHTLNLN